MDKNSVVSTKDIRNNILRSDSFETELILCMYYL